MTEGSEGLALPDACSSCKGNISRRLLPAEFGAAGGRIDPEFVSV
jgi:hypothetical protein